jgi:hypothetical protein
LLADARVSSGVGLVASPQQDDYSRFSITTPPSESRTRSKPFRW